MSAAPYPATTISGGCAVAFDWRHIEDRADWLLLPSTARPWLLMLWFRAWSQQPCGSIPSDHIEICRLIGMPLGEFMPLRDRLLRDWWLADDGRMYHDMIVTQVLDLIARRNLRGHLKHRDEVLARDGAVCKYCGAVDLPLTLDHVVARSRGGPDEPENLVPACRPCNSSKGAKSLEEWRGHAE